MKKISILLSLAIAFFSCNGNSQNQLKRYNVKSGIVEYTTTISGKMMGSTITGSGTETLYFKNWGALELRESESSQSTHVKFFGKEKTETTISHTMNKLDNGESYLVDFEAEKITVGNDIAMVALMESNTNGEDAEKSLLESLGGEKVGNENYKGYNCEVWTIMGGKQWNYKGVMLKMEMNALGINTTTEATNIKFDVAVADSNFNLPDFPIEKSENYITTSEYEEGLDDMDANMDIIANMSFNEWKKMAVTNDEEMKNMSEEELHETYEMIQKMIKMRRGE
jgi:hypothetical protein